MPHIIGKLRKNKSEQNTGRLSVKYRVKLGSGISKMVTGKSRFRNFRISFV